jgi:hypothetical protein
MASGDDPTGDLGVERPSLKYLVASKRESTMMWKNLLKAVSVAGAMVLYTGAANAVTITSVGQDGTVVSGGSIFNAGQAAAWGTASNSAYNPTMDYAGFTLSGAASVTYGVTPTLVMGAPGLMFEVGTSIGGDQISMLSGMCPGGICPENVVITIATAPAPGPFYISVISSNAGAASIGITLSSGPGPVPVPGGLVLFGSVVAGAGAFLRRRRAAGP